MVDSTGKGTVSPFLLLLLRLLFLHSITALVPYVLELPLQKLHLTGCEGTGAHGQEEDGVVHRGRLGE